MKFVWILIFVLFVTISGRPVTANGIKDKGQLSREIARLIQKLDADSNRDRLVAKRGLLKLGVKILPLLPQDLERYSANTTRMLKNIRNSLMHEKAMRSVQPSRVTLKMQSSLRNILKEIVAQTKNRLDIDSISSAVLAKTIDVEFKKREFWKAMDDLAKIARFDFASSKTGFRLKLISHSPIGGNAIGFVSYSGAMRFEVRKIRVLRYRGDESKSLLRLEIVSRIEPRLRPLFLQYRGSEQQVKIDTKTFESFQSGSNFELPFGEGGYSMSFHLDFVVPRNNIPKTLDFHGKFQFTVAAGEETFRFEKPQIPQTQQQVDVKVRTESAQFTKTNKEEGTLAVRIAVSYESPGPEFESHRTWIFHNRAYLEIPDRKKISHDGKINTLLQADGAVLVEYNFEHVPANLKDLRFVYLAPALIVDVPMKVNIARLTLDKQTER